jgi:hypothetical protein
MSGHFSRAQESARRPAVTELPAIKPQIRSSMPSPTIRFHRHRCRAACRASAQELLQPIIGHPPHRRDRPGLLLVPGHVSHLLLANFHAAFSCCGCSSYRFLLSWIVIGWRPRRHVGRPLFLNGPASTTASGLFAYLLGERNA